MKAKRILPSRGRKGGALNKTSSHGSLSYDLIGEDPYLTREEGSEIESSTEQKYSTIATTVALKLIGDDQGELVHLPATSPPSIRDPAKITAVHATMNNSDDGVGIFVSATNTSDDRITRSLSPVVEGEKTDLVPFATNTYAADKVRKGLSTSQSLEGITSVATSDEESGGLTTVERIMSIEMLVSDMCKSLSSIVATTENGQGGGEEIAIGGGDTAISMTEEGNVPGSVAGDSNAGYRSEGVPRDDMLYQESDDNFYINVDL